MCEFFTLDNVYLLVAFGCMFFLLWAQHSLIRSMQEDAKHALNFQRDVLVQNCDLAEDLAKACKRIKELEAEQQNETQS